MKRLASILFLFGALMTAQAQFPVTNNFFLDTYSDSFGVGAFGQRQNFVVMSRAINGNPGYTGSPRDRSRSGDDNRGMKTNREPKLGTLDWGAAQGKTNVYSLWYVSGNHVIGNGGSNGMVVDFADIMQGPVKMYNRNAVFTNDWPFLNSAAYNINIFIGDIAYRGSPPDTGSRDYSHGARTVANSNGIAFVDSYTNMSNAVVTAYAINSNGFWFSGSTNGGIPAYDHPANELNFVWAMTTIKSLEQFYGIESDSNVFTHVLDWNSTTPSQTNHCTVTGISVSGNTLTYTFHADRMGASYYHVTPSQTNDMTGGFALMPSLTNYECEIVRITNAPAGDYIFYEDGVNVGVVSSAKMAAGINMFTDVLKGAIQNQKDHTLELLCDYANVSRTNASDTYQPLGNKLWFKQGSYAGDVWATNNISVTSYVAQSDMVTINTELLTEDQLLHANVQQTNHTFTFQPVQSMTVTNGAVGNLTISRNGIRIIPFVYDPPMTNDHVQASYDLVNWYDDDGITYRPLIIDTNGNWVIEPINLACNQKVFYRVAGEAITP